MPDYNPEVFLLKKYTSDNFKLIGSVGNFNATCQ